MPRMRLTKSAIDALPPAKSDVVYWDAGSPGFGVKITPKGRKVFIMLYRAGGAGSKLRKYTIGPYGRVTLHQARVAAQKVFAAKLEGRDPAAEKREARRRLVADRVEDLLESFITQRLARNRSAGEIARLLRREVGRPWAGRSIHEISKRDVVEVVAAIEQRGAPVAANKTLKSLKTFLRWCVGQAVLDQSPAEGVPLPGKEVTRDRVLNDQELAQVVLAVGQMGGPYSGIVEFLALTGQRREEVARVPSSQTCQPKPQAGWPHTQQKPEPKRMPVRDKARPAFGRWRAIRSRGRHRAATSSRRVLRSGGKRARQAIAAKWMSAPIGVDRDMRRRRHERTAERMREHD